MPLAASTSLMDLVVHFEKHNKTRQIEVHQAKVHSVAWSCDGRRLASGSIDKTVCIMTLDNYRLAKEQTFRGHHMQIDQLIWHPFSPDLVASCSADKTVRVWDVRSKKQIASVTTKGENINLTWSPDGNTIATGSREDHMTFIDARSYTIIGVEQFPKAEVNEISFNNENTHFFMTTGSGEIIILTWPERQELVRIQAHSPATTTICLRFDPTGRHFAVGGSDALVTLWDAYNLACVRTFSRLDWPIRCVSFSHDGALIASGSEDLLIDIGRVDSGERIADLKCDGPTFTVAWHPKEYLLAYACDDKQATYANRDAGIVRLYGIASSDN